MKIRSVFAISLLLAAGMTFPRSHAQGAAQPALQQRVAELKKSMAANRAKLMKYQWLQTTQVTVKGKPRKNQQDMCKYGPDGKVVKTPAGPAEAPQEQPNMKGLRGRVVKKKVAEMKDYAERLKSLIAHYAPPDTQSIQAAMQSGNGDLNVAGGIATLSFKNYYKQGDKVSFAFDTSAKSLVSYDVDTYLDDPKNDVVTLKNQFANLPDGTHYLQQTVLDAKSKEIQITTTNSNYALLAQ